MRYVIVEHLTETDVKVYGTSSGQTFASLEAAKDGVERLRILSGNARIRAYCVPVEQVRNL